MKENKIRQLLKENKCTTSTRIWSTWPFYTEAIGATGNFVKTALKFGVRPRCEVLKPKELQYYIDLGVRDFSLGDEFKKLRELWVDDGTKMAEIVSKL